MVALVGRQILVRSDNLICLFGLLIGAMFATVRQVTQWRFRASECLEQMYLIGVQSAPIIVFALTFVGLMLILEFSFHMKLVLRQDSLVPAFSTVLMLRELGPVITCLLLASRVGAGIAAEIGSMKVTEQLDALQLLSIDPVEYLVIPRWIGSVFAAVSLTVLSVAVSILAGASIAAAKLGSSMPEYFNTMFVFTHFTDLTGCLIKGAVFGTIIPMVAAHQGFRCQAGSAGVGTAATNAVVQSSLFIIIADFLLTYLFYAV